MNLRGWYFRVPDRRSDELVAFWHDGRHCSGTMTKLTLLARPLSGLFECEDYSPSEEGVYS